MNAILSLALSVVAVLLTLASTGWAVMEILAVFSGRFDALSAIFALLAATLAWFFLWLMAEGGDALARDRMRRVVLGGLVVGGVGFALGFFGPLVWAPESNQGPLLGIFWTGPLGFVAGVHGTWILTGLRRRRPAG